MSSQPHLFFQGGTLVLADVAQDTSLSLPSMLHWIKGRWRCEAYHYGEMITWLRDHDIQDKIPRWQRLQLTLQDPRQPHTYQTEAIDAWAQAGNTGSIVLPTGSGKTFLAIRAILSVGRSAVVVAPTIDLLHQWYARLVNAFATEVGVYYGGEKLVLPLTVTTYHSSGDLIADYGNQFKLIIFDEVHHLPAPQWGETALMSPSPFRLGLTATYPQIEEEQAKRWRVADLIGEIVYQLRIEDLAGAQLADYRTERIRIDLSKRERAQYDVDFAIYAGYFRSRKLQRTHGKNWLQELMRLSAIDKDARRALLARQRILHLLASSDGKFTMLDKLLWENYHEQVLVFTENNAVAYEISRRHLIPVITHETKAAERKHILEAFQAGDYHAVVTSRVLNEGVDVPEAKVAIVLGGTGHAREYIQRLGRVLRKVGNRKAVLYEVITRNTTEEGKSQRRRKGQKARK